MNFRLQGSRDLPVYGCINNCSIPSKVAGLAKPLLANLNSQRREFKSQSCLGQWLRAWLQYIPGRPLIQGHFFSK